MEESHSQTKTKISLDTRRQKNGSENRNKRTSLKILKQKYGRASFSNKHKYLT